MTPNEVAELIAINAALYKLGAHPYTDAELKSVAAVWCWHFAKYPAALVKTAFLRANAVCTYPIQPADIFTQLKSMAAEQLPSAQEDWQALTKVLPAVATCMERRKYPLCIGRDERERPIYDNGEIALKDIWDALPQSIRGYLGAPYALAALSRTPLDELDRFRRSEYLTYRKNAPQSEALAALAQSPRYANRKGLEQNANDT